MTAQAFPIDLATLAEPPVGRALVEAAVASHPVAAGVLWELLETIEGMNVGSALAAESLAYARLQGGVEHARWLAQKLPQPHGPKGRVRLERDSGRLHIVLDRSAASNAVDVAIRDGLREAFDLAVLDPEIRRVEWRATGRAFSIGAELAEFGTTRDPARAHEIRMATLPAHALALCGYKLTAFVQGACIGAGLEMVAFANRVVAAPDAWFQLPELAMGLIPGAGGCVSVSRRIGKERAALLVLSGKRIGARTALDWGLVDAIEDFRPADERRAHV